MVWSSNWCRDLSRRILSFQLKNSGSNPLHTTNQNQGIMIRITQEFVQTLEACQKIGSTATAKALLQLADGIVHSDNLLEGDVPMFLNKSVDEIGKLSFASKKRIEYNSWTDEFSASASNTQRVKAKVGKTINKIFTSSFMLGFGINNGDMEIFTSQIKGMFLSNTNEFFSKSNDFSQYNWRNTDENAQDGMGSLGSSCMRNDRCIDDEYFNLYEDSETPVELVTYDEGNGISSRALLWSTDEGKFLDRIYDTLDGDVHRFKAYAHSQGWHTKERQSYNAKLGWTTPSGDTKDIKLIIPVGNVQDHTNYPYMDTMTWAFQDDDGNWYLTNSKEYGHEIHGATHFMDFQSENGHYNDEYMEEIHYFDCDGVQRARAAFNESTVSIYASGVPQDSIIQMNGESELEFERYNSDGDRNIYCIDDMYYHRSELKRCNLSGNMCPKSVEFILFEGEMVNPKFLIKDHYGNMVEKRRCRYYFNKDNKIIIKLSSEVNTITDAFGMLRDADECVYISGRIDAWILKSELALVKLMESRVKQSTRVRNCTINPLNN